MIAVYNLKESLKKELKKLKIEKATKKEILNDLKKLDYLDELIDTKEAFLCKIKETYELLYDLHNTRYIKLSEVAKELKIKQTELVKFIKENPYHFNYVHKRKSENKPWVLYISDVFIKLEDNEETEEYIKHNIEKYKNTLKVSYYDNYGRIEGSFLDLSKKQEAKFLNTKEKLEKIKEKYQLKQAKYYIGGLGDCALIEPEGALELNQEVYDQLKKDGWELIGEYKDSGFSKGII